MRVHVAHEIRAESNGITLLMDVASAQKARGMRLDAEDTLAEIAFLRGDNARAVNLTEQCIALNPFKAHYREQLERFQAGPDE